MPSLVEIGQVVWRRRFYNFVNVSLPFRNYMYLPLEKGMTFHLNKLEFPPPKDALCQVWFEIGPVVLEEKILKFRQCIFAIS